jgi:hypothetical protein
MPLGVFSEAGHEEPPPQGIVELTIKASIKKPVEGYYLLEPKSPSRENEGYPFELNLNGQEIIWTVEGKDDIMPRYDNNGSRMPEGGQGIRYVLNKKLWLNPGPYHVLFGLPQEDYYTEVKLSLKGDRPHTFEFAPIYAMGPRGVHSFYHGIKTFSVFLDGTQIK